MITVLFTRSDSAMSWAIRSVTKEPVSHCGLLVFNKYVLHSNLLGVQINRYDQFSKKNVILYTIDLPNNKQAILNILSINGLKLYDIGALLYLALRYLFPVLPKKNLWQSSGMYLCTELVTEVVDGAEDSMVTPYQLYLRLRDKQQENRNVR